MELVCSVSNLGQIDGHHYALQDRNPSISPITVGHQPTETTARPKKNIFFTVKTNAKYL